MTATITPVFCPISLTPLLDRNGVPIRGGMVYFFDAGTTNLRNVYQDEALSTPYPSPIKTDAFGRIPVIWVSTGSYKFELHDAANALLASADNLPGGIETFDTPSTPSGWVTGDMKFAHGAGIQDGWIVANGKTIGNQNSSATARANADTQALFVWLWNQDGSLAVSGGRGTTATGDYSSGKTIAVPDYRGRGARGVDQMGGALTAGVITAATTATPDQVGTAIGTETVTLSVAQLPAAGPATLTIAAAGGHSHTGSTDSQGAHTHTIIDPGHNHTSNAICSAVPANAVNSNAFVGSVSAATINTATTGISINSAGAHTHNVTTVAVADHTHAATIVLGSGNAHSNMPPGVLGYWHIRL